MKRLLEAHPNISEDPLNLPNNQASKPIIIKRKQDSHLSVSQSARAINLWKILSQIEAI